MKEQLRRLIQEALSALEIDLILEEISLEKPKESTHGDYASSVAMQLAKQRKMNPRLLAEQIVGKIKSPDIEKIEIAGPGFINFYLSKHYLLENINTIIEAGSHYGATIQEKPIKINVEFVSANPTGTLHLGHARGACYGAALSNILSFAGYEVTREYYINDAGNQICKLEQSILARYRGLCGEEEQMPEDGYHGKEIIALAQELYAQYGNTTLAEKVIKQKGLEYLLKQIQTDLSQFRVSFDVWTSEQSLYDKGLVEETLEALKKSGYTYEQEGAFWLKTTLYGDEKNRVLVKNDGNNTYLLPDIAYHIDKYNRGFDQLVDVLGADHHGYIHRLKAALQILSKNPDQLEVKILQMVRLLRDGQEVKMSKRTGNAVTMRELVDEVGVDASRYFFTMRSLDTQLDFDLDLALKNTNENPVYYIQYAHARICTILKDANYDFTRIENYVTIHSDYAYNLLSMLYEWQAVVNKSAKNKAPHQITNYLYEVATLFHSFYAHEKILSEDLQATKERLNLIKATAIVIENALALIGVEAKESM